MGGSASKVHEQMADMAGKWNSRDVKGSQTELFWKIVSDEEVDFEGPFKENQLDYVFTSEKIIHNLLPGAPGKRYNTLQLWRDAVNGRTAIPIFEFNDPERGKYIVMMPLGEPGRDLGSHHASKCSHLIVIKASRVGCVTFNDVLPTTPEETEDLEFRMGLLDKAYDMLKRTAAVEECGTMVKEKATQMGVEHRVGIRQFLATMIAELPDKGGRPGFVLKNSEDVDVAENSQSVAEMLEAVFTNQSLKSFKLVQPPTHNSVVISHVHGFLLTEVPECMKETYVVCEDILKVKKEHQDMMQPVLEHQLDVSEEEDNGCELVRTNTNTLTSVGSS